MYSCNRKLFLVGTNVDCGKQRNHPLFLEQLSKFLQDRIKGSNYRPLLAVFFAKNGTLTLKELHDPLGWMFVYLNDTL